jgi:hypothetical protein
LEFQVLTKIRLEWRADGDSDPRHFDILDLDNHFIPSVAQIEKSISSVAGNCLSG